MRKIFIGFISFILVIGIIGVNVYISISNSISSNSIKNNVSNNFMSGIIYDDNGNKSEIFNTIVRLSGLDEDTVLKLMENETAKKYITDVVNSIYDYNLTGDDSYKYTGDKIYDIVDQNIDKVMSEIDYPFSESDKREVIKYMNNNMDYIIDTIYSTDIGGYTRD